MRKKLLIGLLSVVVLAGVLEYVLYTQRPTEGVAPVPVACTAEALMCPDGSGVGRGGPACTFAPCPDRPSFTGELREQGGAYTLVVPASEGGGGEVTYILPLTDVFVAEALPLVGREVVVTGTFRFGNTLAVATLNAVPDQPIVDTDTALSTLTLGETKLVRGVLITLEEVTADSRCPSDVQCITAGSVSTRVTLTGNTDSEVYTLRSDESPHAFDAYQVSIADVTPVPVSTEEIDNASYQVTFRVEPLQAPSPIEAYLREHITELSPAKAVLGGTWYVTSVRVTGENAAVVEYEDGHIAFTADVLFSIDAATDDVTVDDFVIRRQ